MRSLYVVLVAVAGCAQAGPSERVNPDASVTRNDGSIGGDSNVSGTDAGCTIVTTNLLANGNFDAGGTGWTVTPILAGDPIINTQATDSGPVGAQSPTYRAWMGGVVALTATPVADSMYQDVAIPASTTMLVFNGYYEVRSAETTATVYDRGVAELATTAGTRLELIKALDDNGKTTAWTTFTKTIAATVAGTTVRLKFSTTNDDFAASSFYFDSVSLDATYCQ